METPERRAWLGSLSSVISELRERWSLSIEDPFCDEASCAWVAPAIRDDGSHAVLKLGMPHMEAEHELHGLRFWNGDPSVFVLEADEKLNAMLLERCLPGTVLRQLPELEQDAIIANLLRRLWRRPPEPHPFRPLAAMMDYWTNETRTAQGRWPDAGLVNEGLQLFGELSRPSSDDVLLATDLHAGNVLRAQREPWLVIDPKPFVGDPAYDATQHLLNCTTRVRANPDATIGRFADLLEVDGQRLRFWLFARSAAEPRNVWSEESIALARLLA
jgi:streptomycin 6-kinase